MLDIISQVGMFLFGFSAIWILGRKESWNRLGYIMGLIGQPFWLYMEITTHQWGLLLLTIFYTYSWCQGIYNYWIKDNERWG